MNELIICEKPKSSEKIAQALSPKAKKMKYNKKVVYWEINNGDKITRVLSAVGHLYSLKPENPKEKNFFELKWVPAFETGKTKAFTKDYVNAIKKFSKDAETFVHACDYDIEGTVIGYNALKHGCGQESLDNTRRMKFSTLTKGDIQKAYANMIKVDMKQVDSGLARHYLDFIFGVNISKSLMKSVRVAKSRFLKLSAGRVQTPSLSILVEREKEIQKFIPEPYWMIKAKLEKEIIADNKREKIFEKKIMENALLSCGGKDATVSKVNIKETTTKPPVPFNLGGLQAEAHTTFGFSPKRTQVVAQNLYSEGYTSYPRTSSQKLPKSLDFKSIFEGLSKSSKLKEHIDELPQKTKPNEGKKDDAAHPAIHPTGTLPKGLDKDALKIYDLIVFRFISVFGDDAKVERMDTDLLIGKEEFNFKRKRTSYLGWLKHYPYRKVDYDDFPEIKKGDELKVKKIISEEKETKPPARYNEASLIKELEKRGLGTKATRADIIAKLYDRDYISGKKIEVNQLGENIIDTLKEYCKDLTSEELTRQFETELEEIMSGKIKREKVVDEAKGEVLKIISDIEKNQAEIGEQLYDAYQRSQIVDKCVCKGNLTIRYSPKTKSQFVGCSNYPECTVIYSLPRGATVLKKKCEKCGLPLISFGSQKQRQKACLDPKCGKHDQIQKEAEVVGKCPDCGKNLLKRSGRYGEFIGCEGFPKCRFTKSVDEIDQIKEK
ncbi:MAG: DNA topoisomerase I [Methanobacteriaceae archaeon]